MVHRQRLLKAVPITSGNWKKLLIRSKNGVILANHFNISVALAYAPAWRGVLSFNEFAQRVEAIGPTPWGYTGPWSDVEDTRATMWMQAEAINARVDVVGAAIQQHAQKTRFHPVRDYLESLDWDGITRIDNWLTTYLGCPMGTDYISAVGSRWLISAVARIFRPGCKSDCVLILEGPQGVFKSTALRIMGGQWFCDEIADLGTKDSALQTFGVWIVELSELDCMSRAEVGKIKAFISRSTDRFRPPYGKRVIEAPRQCVFAGSVNQSSYLRDETGGRRFWPVQVGRILIDELREDRDQLWAEAVERYRAGATWWLDSPELNQAAQEEQFDRYEGDPWDSAIARFVNRRETVSIAEVLRDAIDKPKGQWTQVDQNRVSRILTALGWEKFQRTEGDVRERRWRKRGTK